MILVVGGKDVNKLNYLARYIRQGRKLHSVAG